MPWLAHEKKSSKPKFFKKKKGKKHQKKAVNSCKCFACGEIGQNANKCPNKRKMADKVKFIEEEYEAFLLDEYETDADSIYELIDCPTTDSEEFPSQDEESYLEFMDYEH